MQMQIETTKLEEYDYYMLWIVDFLGILRGRSIPGKFVSSALSEGLGFDGSSVIGYSTIEKSDLRMKADPSSFSPLPYYFYNKKVAKYFCDVITNKGEEFSRNPRKVCKDYEKNIGYEVKISAEPEFYLIDPVRLEPIEDAFGNQYFDQYPGRDKTESFRMEFSDALKIAGIEVERMHHEVGPAQCEINFKYSSMLKTADNVITYKFFAKKVAEKFGWIATFMPKPWVHRTGSGMHIHLSLSKNGKNLFYDEKEGISQFCLYFIGGILEHAKALSAVAAPTINSYRRLKPGFEAPVYISWGWSNRSAMIRIPHYSKIKESDARIELRLPDPTSNPYFLFPCLIEAGLDGVNKKISPKGYTEENVYEAKEKYETLPSSLYEALSYWENDDICYRALGKEIAETYKELLLNEWKEFSKKYSSMGSSVTEWELNNYLHR